MGEFLYEGRTVWVYAMFADGTAVVRYLHDPKLFYVAVGNLRALVQEKV